MQCIMHVGYVTSNGYGQKKHKGKVVAAHRLAYALANNLDVRTMGGSVQHSCDNPLCINPDHLSLGTQKTNSEDMYDKGRQASKLTTEQAASIRSTVVFGRGGNVSFLARQYGVSRSTISLIGNNKAWLRA